MTSETRDTLRRCACCPSPCRRAIPPDTARQVETDTPSGLAMIALAVIDGALDFDEPVRRALSPPDAGPCFRAACTHGLDIAAKQGTPIVAADAGYVAVLQSSRSGYGNMIVADHGNGYQTRYAHLSAFYVEAGQSVNKGDTVGLCGSTGNSTGPHLHFEVIINGVRYNPQSYLP